jgi:transcriptional regulator with XRE-family HTH domain
LKNSPSAVTLEPIAVGERLTEARRRAGLSQKALADRLGISMWAVEELEKDRRDITPHLEEISEATQLAPEWFSLATAAEADGARNPAKRHSRVLTRATGGRDLVLGAIALLVLIRFFTEVVPFIPRAANFIDIPIFLALALAAMSRPQRLSRPSGYLSLAGPLFLFIAACVISVALNPSRVEPGPVLVFLYGFLAPFGVYAAVHCLWPPGQAASLTRLLIGLGVAQLVVVAAIDLRRFVQTQSGDVISGTFGTNAYQLVFFLLVIIGLLAGIFTFEPGRLTARLAPVLILLALGTIFLAQYRALLVTTVVTILLLAALLGTRGRSLATAAIIVISFGITFSYVASHFPILRLGPTASVLQKDPGFLPAQRFHAAGALVNLYGDKPLSIAVGTGPGTFSSRAWQTFALAESTSKSNVQGRYVKLLTGGKPYSTDVSAKYVTPRLGVGSAVLGSTAVTSPFSSYLSLAAEVGLLGLVLIAGIYLKATARAIRNARVALSESTPGDPLPALTLASIVALTVLLQMGLLDNWFEVTRVTFIAWILLAVTSKELSARSERPL